MTEGGSMADTAATQPSTEAATDSDALQESDNVSKGPAWLVAGGIFLGTFAIVIFVVGPLRHWFAYHTGVLHAGPDVYYNFWSGFGSDLGEATLIGSVSVGVYAGVRKVNCHVKGCWRVGKHPLIGTPYTLCRHHHPHVPTEGASHAHILEQYRQHLAKLEEHGHHHPDANS
jgi:hypothetical protein